MSGEPGGLIPSPWVLKPPSTRRRAARLSIHIDPATSQTLCRARGRAFGSPLGPPSITLRHSLGTDEITFILRGQPVKLPSTEAKEINEFPKGILAAVTLTGKIKRALEAAADQREPVTIDEDEQRQDLLERLDLIAKIHPLDEGQQRLYEHVTQPLSMPPPEAS